MLTALVLPKCDKIYLSILYWREFFTENETTNENEWDQEKLTQTDHHSTTFRFCILLETTSNSGKLPNVTFCTSPSLPPFSVTMLSRLLAFFSCVRFSILWLIFSSIMALIRPVLSLSLFSDRVRCRSSRFGNLYGLYRTCGVTGRTRKPIATLLT